jgi:Outer membrane protein beta-barrel domain
MIIRQINNREKAKIRFLISHFIFLFWFYIDKDVLLITLAKSNYMKKISVTLFVLVCLTTLSSGQPSRFKDDSKYTIGIFGGLNIPRLSGGNNNELSRDYTSRAGEALGLTSSLYLGSNFSLRVDLMYSSEGGKRNGIQAFDASSINPLVPAGTYFYAKYDNESILNYAEIPVMAKYSIPIRKSSKFFVDFGPYVGFLLNAKQKTSGSSIIYADRAETMIVVPEAQSFDASTNVSSSINPINFGLTGGVGFAQTVSSGEIFMDVRGAYGIIVIQKDSQDGSSHNGNLLIDLGYAMHF